MTGETEKDGTQDTPAEPTLPKPVFTETSEVQRSETDPLAPVKALLEQQRRDIQSMVDKSLATQEKRQEQRLASLGVLGEYKQLVKEGYSEREAEQELRLRQIEQVAPAQAVPGRTVQGDEKADSQFDLAAFLKDKGVDGNHAEVLQIIRTPHTNPEQLKNDLLEWKLRQLTAPNPGASTAPAMQGGEQAAPDSDAEVLKKMFGQPNPFFDAKTARAMGGGVVKAK